MGIFNKKFSENKFMPLKTDLNSKK